MGIQYENRSSFKYIVPRFAGALLPWKLSQYRPPEIRVLECCFIANAVPLYSHGNSVQLFCRQSAGLSHVYHTLVLWVNETSCAHEIFAIRQPRHDPIFLRDKVRLEILTANCERFNKPPWVWLIHGNGQYTWAQVICVCCVHLRIASRCSALSQRQLSFTC